MKGKVLAVLGVLAVLAVTVLLIASMAVLPEYVPEYSVQTPAPEPSRTVPVQLGEPAAANSTAAAEPVPAVPTPLPTQQELAEMDERLREAAPRMSLFERAFRWRYSGGLDNMPQDEHDNARALFMRFVDKFAGIRTAQFRFERYEEQADGSQQLLYVQDVWWEG
ncbi:MAG: hypothetical protein NTZ09_13215, partial [Candidatus Hydrogenedentes bacterium]|nr:hypothetical protein [Candidatus Hydrogenedentota bacterium]